MTEQQTANGLDVHDRVDRYLRVSGLPAGNARVVPLTGDASDRRYFRIIPADGAPLVLAVHAGPIEFSRMPFANVARLLRQMPLPARAILAHSVELGIVALQDRAAVTVQAYLRASSLIEHALLHL